MVNGYTHPNDILAFCPELCGAIRRVELQLEEVLRLIPASVEEEREKGMQEARNDAWQTVKERMDRFPDLRRVRPLARDEESARAARRGPQPRLPRNGAQRLLDTATAKVEEYRNTVRHGGVGFSAIAEEHFRATEGQGVAAAAFRAAQSELVDSLVEEQRSTVRFIGVVSCVAWKARITPPLPPPPSLSYSPRVPARAGAGALLHDPAGQAAAREDRPPEEPADLRDR